MATSSVDQPSARRRVMKAPRRSWKVTPSTPALRQAFLRRHAGRESRRPGRDPGPGARRSDGLEQLHRDEGVDRSYARRLIRIAFRAPALKRAILDGAAPPDLTVQNLKRGYRPLNWADQEAVYRRPA
jgi:hypothetical protein